MAFKTYGYTVDAGALQGSFGMALRAGRLVATVVSRKTGKHITVQVRAKRRELRNRRFRLCEMEEAERLYLDTPRPDGGGTEVGCLHLSGKWAGSILPPWEKDFDEARLWAARRVLDVAHGRAPLADDQAEILQERECLVCGRELTDPESISRDIGPECWKRVSGLSAEQGEHQQPFDAFLDLGEGNAEDGANGIEVSDGASAEEALEAFAESGGLAELQQFGAEVREERDVEEEVAELAGRTFDERGEEIPEEQIRAEIEAELQTTVPAEDDGQDLGATVSVDDGLVLLRAGDDPRELLEEVGADG